MAAGSGISLRSLNCTLCFTQRVTFAPQIRHPALPRHSSSSGNGSVATLATISTGTDTVRHPPYNARSNATKMCATLGKFPQTGTRLSARETFLIRCDTALEHSIGRVQTLGILNMPLRMMPFPAPICIVPIIPWHHTMAQLRLGILCANMCCRKFYRQCDFVEAWARVWCWLYSQRAWSPMREQVVCVAVGKDTMRECMMLSSAGMTHGLLSRYSRCEPKSEEKEAKLPFVDAVCFQDLSKQESLAV